MLKSLKWTARKSVIAEHPQILLNKFVVRAKNSIIFALLLVCFCRVQLCQRESYVNFYNESNVKIPEMNRT